MCFVTFFFPGTDAGLITLLGFASACRPGGARWLFLAMKLHFCRLSTQYTPYDVTPVTNIIATTTRWDRQLPIMEDVMRAAAALFLSVRQGGC
jgi:hypothetical protein